MRWIDGALTGSNRLALAIAGMLAATALLLPAPAALATLAADSAVRAQAEIRNHGHDQAEEAAVDHCKSDLAADGAAALADGPVHPIEPGRRLPVPPAPAGPTHPIEPKPGKPGR